ncbi:hypothetical protein NDU88_002795 [Pleurodeles waltl]|uniref:Uncharacterized protein n=1 Tax=Pleurodeles waltl TaxID=8319 RepID=A0AAV7VDV3_PLEWA|nr:hypothetical protein NDU88_002795 [Pleurodeles waltl]
MLRIIYLIEVNFLDGGTEYLCTTVFLTYTRRAWKRWKNIFTTYLLALAGDKYSPIRKGTYEDTLKKKLGELLEADVKAVGYGGKIIEIMGKQWMDISFKNRGVHGKVYVTSEGTNCGILPPHLRAAGLHGDAECVDLERSPRRARESEDDG